MNFTQSGVPLSFEVTYSPGLFVAMKVYDTTTGSAVFVSTIGMTNFSGSSYFGNFTPTAGKTYSINKAVYTDGTYAVKRSGYSEGSETIRADDLAGLIWNALTASYADSGSFGAAVGGIGGASTPPVNLICTIEPTTELNLEIEE